MSEYGGVEVLRLNPSLPDPVPADDEILIRIHATSVNPIDAVRRMGYGRRVFKLLGAKMPLILGHDASGVVVKTGRNVTRFKAGDAVWIAPDAFRDGTYAEYVAVREREVAMKPQNLTHEEAASIPYVALTTWAALVGTGAIEPGKAAGKTVLVHAGSGGIGSFAIQLLKAWGANVATTCGPGNVEFCRSLGADRVIDYSREDFAKELKDIDVVFDTLGYLAGVEKGSLRVLRRGAGAHYVSIVNPLLPWIDEGGFILGGARVALTLLGMKIWMRLWKGARYSWAHFSTSGAVLEEIRTLVEAGKVRPVVQTVMDLSDVAKAHTAIESRRTRGKIVLHCLAADAA
ncbi:MAG: zinc-binding dehydrogenase [Alphaproteobacteria bacterium]|nr:zinc-binding dehydrogenase [Alphaproteobacteria bacterium]